MLGAGKMSYGICRVQKMGAGSVKGIQIHDKRDKKGVSHTNADIDWNKTSLNYDLHPANNKNFNLAVNQRISQLNLKKAVRKDAVVMAQVLVTSDNDFFKKLDSEQQAEFFKDSYEFLSQRYGKENIISAIVHLDEHTPHMHFNFVPVTEDGRLSAKTVLNRKSLIEQQDSFIEIVGKKYGLERGVRSDERREHLETADYKLKTTLEKKQKAEQQLEKLQGRILTEQEVIALNGRKSLSGALKGVTYEEYQNLKKTAESVNKAKIAVLNAKAETKQAKAETSKTEIRYLIEIATLKSELQNQKIYYEKIFNNLSPEALQEVNRIKKILNQSKSTKREIDI